MQLTKAKLKQLIKEALSVQDEVMSDDEVFAITRASSKAEQAGWRSPAFEEFKELVMNAIERAVPEATDEALQNIAQNMRAHLENLSADLRDTPGGLMPRLTREFLAALAVEAARISPQLELPINESQRKPTMKLTKTKLKQIIKEEIQKLIKEEGEVFAWDRGDWSPKNCDEARAYYDTQVHDEIYMHAGGDEIWYQDKLIEFVEQYPNCFKEEFSMLKRDKLEFLQSTYEAAQLHHQAAGAKK